jgi:hypothetical protein
MRWLLFYENGTIDISESEPDYSNDCLVEVPQVQKVELLGRPIGKKYAPKVWRVAGARESGGGK